MRRGATTTEYGLIVVAIALFLIPGLMSVSARLGAVHGRLALVYAPETFMSQAFPSYSVSGQMGQGNLYQLFADMCPQCGISVNQANQMHGSFDTNTTSFLEQAEFDTLMSCGTQQGWIACLDGP